MKLSTKSILRGGSNHTTHHLLDIREPGETLVALRTELLNHPEISAYAQEGKSFSECIARIATQLDIALDGEYDPNDLMEMLTLALKAHGRGEKTPHNLARGLLNVELEEKENTVELVQRDLIPSPSSIH